MYIFVNAVIIPHLPSFLFCFPLPSVSCCPPPCPPRPSPRLSLPGLPTLRLFFCVPRLVIIAHYVFLSPQPPHRLTAPPWEGSPADRPAFSRTSATDLQTQYLFVDSDIPTLLLFFCVPRLVVIAHHFFQSPQPPHRLTAPPWEASPAGRRAFSRTSGTDLRRLYLFGDSVSY